MHSDGQTALLKFDPSLNRIDNGKKELRDGLSAVVAIGDTLWLACDETTRLERLTRSRGNVYGDHKAFALRDYLRLPADDKEEADIEGLDIAGGYLWLVGSHSLKRGILKPDKPAAENRKRLAGSTADGNRFLLARIPLVRNGKTVTLAKSTGSGAKKRVASQLHGDATGNDLTAALQDDEHLKPFLAIPGKDNGFDVEGLCVVEERVFVGLRGPVLRGWCTILELAVHDDPEHPSMFGLDAIGPGRRPYKKHFLDLGGLGIRDLCVSGPDILILAGPTMVASGPVRVLRWRNGAKPSAESVTFAEAIEQVTEVPYGIGVDHAEGITLLPADDQGHRSMLVIYDAPSETRKKGRPGDVVVRADIFPLGQA